MNQLIGLEKMAEILKKYKILLNSMPDNKLLDKKIINLLQIEMELLKTINPCQFFGPLDWLDYYGININKLEYPADKIKKILEEDCPFHEGKKKKETHFLMYCPPRLSSITKMKKKYVIDKRPIIYYQRDDFATEIFTNEPTTSEWVLMYEGIMPHSEGVMRLEDLYKILPKNYEVPTACEAVLQHLLIYSKRGEQVNPKMFGRTRTVYSKESPEHFPPDILVGHFSKYIELHYYKPCQFVFHLGGFCCQYLK